ncbi:hypothetical protein ACIP97_20555 [Peribacillus frigoritolerans]|uniref:hypothetical protein n=1 Tax=Peribacillus frigoritolerans TaxID=450367 RepID=UPI0037FC6012
MNKMGYMIYFTKGFAVFKMLLESKKQLDDFLKALKKTDVNIETIEEIVTESKGLLDKTTHSFLQIIGKEKDVFGYFEIPKPKSDNKEIILNWLYEESEAIINQLWYKSSKNFNKAMNVPSLLKPFTYSTEKNTEYKKIQELMEIETFILKSRIEKINEYQFEAIDTKRIEEAEALYKSLTTKMTYKDFGECFKQTDMVLVAHFSREYINWYFFNNEDNFTN